MNKITAWLGVIVVLVGVGQAGAARADSWQLAAFGGSPVTLLVNNPVRANDLAAVVGGVLEISGDGGFTRNVSLPPQPVEAISYDPFYIETIYIGTPAGLYVTRNDGISWDPFGKPPSSYQNAVAVCAQDSFIYAVMADASGASQRLLRFDRGGSVPADTKLPADHLTMPLVLTRRLAAAPRHPACPVLRLFSRCRVCSRCPIPAACHGPVAAHCLWRCRFSRQFSASGGFGAAVPGCLDCSIVRT